MTEQAWASGQESGVVSRDAIQLMREQSAGSSLPAAEVSPSGPQRSSARTPRQLEVGSYPDLTVGNEELDWTEDPVQLLPAAPVMGRTERARMQRTLTLVFVSLFAYSVLAAPVAAALLADERWKRVEPMLTDSRQVVTSLVLLIVGYFFGKRSE